MNIHCVNQALKRQFVLLLVTISVASLSTAAEWANTLPVGTEFPTITANDQSGLQRTNQNLMGENGLLFMFNRSSNW